MISFHQRVTGRQNNSPGLQKESLIHSEILCGTGMCRPKSDNPAMTSVIDFEARAFGELSRAVEIALHLARSRLHGCTPAWMQVVERRREQAAEVVERRREQAAEVVERRREQAAEVVEPRLPAAGRSGTSGRDESRMDSIRASKISPAHARQNAEGPGFRQQRHRAAAAGSAPGLNPGPGIAAV